MAGRGAERFAVCRATPQCTDQPAGYAMSWKQANGNLVEEVIENSQEFLNIEL